MELQIVAAYGNSIDGGEALIKLSDTEYEYQNHFNGLVEIVSETDAMDIKADIQAEAEKIMQGPGYKKVEALLMDIHRQLGRMMQFKA